MARTSDKSFLLIIQAMEPAYVRKLYKARYIYYQFFVSEIQTNGIDAARAKLATLTANNELVNVLNSIYKHYGLKGARLTYNELRASLKEGQKAGRFGRNERWIAEVQNYLKLNLLQFAEYITETVKEDIMKILLEGVDEGWGIDQLVEALMDVEIPQRRARVIARTEIVRAMNVGHQVGAREFPYEVSKKWNAARDHRTRHAHVTVNGNQVDEDDYFKVPIYKGRTIIGFDEMNAPGDPKASPQNTINCRCRITHIPKRDAQGNLIPRNATTARVIPLRSSNLQNSNILRAIAAQVKMLVD